MSLLPQVVSIGPFSLNLYPFLIACASGLSVAWLYRCDVSFKMLLGALALTLGGLVAGQLGYLGLHWEALREGALPTGLSEHAALLGAWLGYRALKRQLPESLGAALWTITSLIGIAACLGCIPNGCGVGREVFWQHDGETSLAWRMHVDWPDMTLTHAPRLPTQAWLAGWLALGAGLSRSRSTLSGAEASVIWFAIGDFLVQFARGDDVLIWGGLRLYQWLDALLIAVVMTSHALLRIKNKSSNQVNYTAPPA